MGTNYYWYSEAKCPCCGRESEPLHIGKSSGGWCFSLHVIPEDGINDLGDWVILFDKEGSYIQDEYGDVVNTIDMIQNITQRSWLDREYVNPDWYKQNGAVVGPHGLARHAIDGHHCIGHGDGTYDYIVGEFS